MYITHSSTIEPKQSKKVITKQINRGRSTRLQYKKLTEYTAFEVGAITLDPGPGIPDLADVL